MKRALAVLFLAAVAIAIAALAAPADNTASKDKDPVTAALLNMLQRGQQNLVGAAEEMPADKYSFKATPEQMSFAKMVSHTAESNAMLCANISGASAPESAKAEENAGKDKLVQALQQSFEFCSQQLAKTGDSKLGEQVPFFGGRKVSRAQAMMALAADWADHYSLAATYLRLNNLLPPSAKKK